MKPYRCGILVINLPRLNMAIPRPASDKMDMDLATMAGITTPHLQRSQAIVRGRKQQCCDWICD